MKLLFLSFFCFLVFLVAPLKADDDTTAENASAEVADVSTPDDNKTKEQPNDNSADIIKKNSANSISNINRHIDLNYSYLDDLNLNLNDPIPIDGDPENYIIIYLEKKPVLIKLFPDIAPKTVAIIKALVREGFYDNTDFFRLIPNYIIQGGDPTSSGYGGTGKLRKAEISNDVKFKRGSVAIANSGNLESDDSQFFISFDSFPWLDGKYTIFGNVISGMDFLENLQSSFSNNGFLSEPLIIEKVSVVKDLNPSKILSSNPQSKLSLATQANK